MGCENDGEQAQAKNAEPLGKIRVVLEVVPRRQEDVPTGAPRPYAKHKAFPEYKQCSLTQHGELKCDHVGEAPPWQDCRQPWCPHAPIMRNRALGRMRALEEKKHGGR